MTGPDARLDMIPGPDPGACPDCGGWRKAGMRHDCEEHRAETRRSAEAIAATLGRPSAGPAADPRVETIRQALPALPSNNHLGHCKMHNGGECDCPVHLRSPARAALDSLAADLARAEARGDAEMERAEALRKRVIVAERALDAYDGNDELLDALARRVDLDELEARHAQTVEALERELALHEEILYQRETPSQQTADLIAGIRRALAADTEAGT